MIEKNGTVEKLTKLKFKKLMADLLDDFPELAAKVKAGEFRYKNTPAIVQAYNDYFVSR